MTKNEFERLRIFLKRYPNNRISFENVYLYFHCPEADKAQCERRGKQGKSRFGPTDFEIRKKLGKLAISLDYRTLKVDVEKDVLIGRPSGWLNSRAKSVSVPRKEIKKINLGISYFPRTEEGPLSSGFIVRF